jgi:broad specificity phosphatase PhoE
MSEIFYIIRHGETDWNVAKRLQGHSNIPLNELGKQQALSLSVRASQLKAQILISSDLIRASETARLSFPGVPLLTDKALREVNLGDAEGMTRNEILEKWGEELWTEWASNEKAHWNSKFPGGESRIEMLDRLQSSLHQQLDQNQGRLVVFFSHGLAMRSLAFLLQDQLPQDFFVENCGVLKLKRTSNKFEVLDYYDQSRSVT